MGADRFSSVSICCGRWKSAEVWLRVAHAEGLAGQHAAHHDALEQVALLEGRQQEGHASLFGQGTDRRFVVNIVHAGLFVAGQEVLDKFIDGAHGQRGNGVLKAQHVGNVRAGQREGLLLGVAKADSGHVRVAPCNQSQQYRAAVHIEQHAVDGLNFNRRRVDVAHLGKAVTGGMVLPLLGGQGGLQFFPVSFRGRQRMVAVAHGQRQRLCALDLRVLGVKGFLTAKAVQGRVDLLQQCRVLDSPACDVAAAEHQFALVDLFQLVLLGSDGFNQGAVRVIGQHHDMGRFEAGTPAHGHTGRDAAFHSLLTGTNLRAGTPRIAVGLKVDFAYKALPHPAALLGALDVDEAIHGPGQDVPGIIVHRLMDLCNACRNVIVFQIDFRQNQVQGAGAARSRLFGALPIGAVTGKLIAGHTAPLLQRDLLRRQKDVRRGKARCLVHFGFLAFIGSITQTDPLHRHE